MDNLVTLISNAKNFAKGWGSRVLMHLFNPMLRRQRLPTASLVYMGNYRPDRTIHSEIFQKRGRHARLVTPWYKWWFIIPKAQVQFPVCLRWWRLQSMPLISAHRGRGRQISVNLRSAWSTELGSRSVRASQGNPVLR